MKTNKAQKPPSLAPVPSPMPSSPPPGPPQNISKPARRIGKIARLPREIREEINRMLSGGTPYTAIVKEIAAKGYHLNHSNISRWFSGGYQDWLREQACLDEMRTRLDFASKLVDERNSQLLNQASLRIAVLRLFNLLSDFDPAILKPKIAEHPGTYARLLNALCKLTQGDLKFERHRLNQHHTSHEPDHAQGLE